MSSLKKVVLACVLALSGSIAVGCEEMKHRNHDSMADCKMCHCKMHTSSTQPSAAEHGSDSGDAAH